jgi:hypothetical protein
MTISGSESIIQKSHRCDSPVFLVEVVFRQAHPSRLSAYLRVVDAEGTEADAIADGTTLETHLRNEVDSNRGTIDYVAGIIAAPQRTGAFTLATWSPLAQPAVLQGGWSSPDTIVEWVARR